VVVALASFEALWKYRVGTLKVIGACAVVGLVYTLIILETAVGRA